uniref:Elongation factor Ts, mitochondrial n=1 Tax=Haemonchus placei TaxID=6290 RepID=A0A0N4WZZ6_HAEPC
LMKLRKRTGYSYVNCRKALVKFGADNISEAEKWLREQAKSEGWAKAAKLGGRATTQGLVAVKSTGSVAAIVELSCETDFREEKASKIWLVADTAISILPLLLLLLLIEVSVRQLILINSCPPTTRVVYTFVDFQSLADVNGKPLSELIAMTVGKLGENITIRSMRALYAPPKSCLYSASHPKEGNSSVSMGKFASVIALKRPNVEGLFPTEKLAAQLCQHVIGMRSETLGEPPEERKPEERKVEVEENRDELNDFEQTQTTNIDEDETALLRQAFMLNPSQTVYEYVTGHQAEIVDFVRSELGETAE